MVSFQEKHLGFICWIVCVGLLNCWPQEIVAADITSTLMGSGNWSNPGIWNTVDFPNNGNNGLTYDASISSGSATLDVDVVINTLTLTNGTIGGAFDLTLVANSSTWTRGSLSGSGTTTVDTGAVLTISGGTQFGQSRDLHRDLVNRGQLDLTAQQLTLGDGTGSVTITNELGATFNATPTASGTNVSGVAGTTAVFNNEGDFIKSGSSSLGFGNLTFNNSGTVDVQQGTLFMSSGAHAGDFQGVGELVFSGTGATHDLLAGSSVSTSTVTVSDGTMNVAGSYTAGTTNLSGTANFNTPASLNNLSFTSGSLGGSGDLTLTGSSTWTRGSLSGSGTTTVDTGAVLTIRGTEPTLQRDLTNTGQIILTGRPSLTLGDGTGSVTITNELGATFNATLTNGGTNVTGVAGTTAVFNNEGDFIKSGSSSLGFGNLTFNNSGTVDVQQGTLFVGGTFNSSGGTLQGPISVARYEGIGSETQIVGGFVAGDAEVSGGETIVLPGSSFSLTTGSALVTAVSETVSGTLVNFGVINGDVVVEGGRLNGAGIIDGDLILRGATVENTQFASGTSENIDVKGDLIVEPPGLGISASGGSFLVGDTISVTGSTFIRTSFDLTGGVLVGIADHRTDVVIENNGQLILGNENQPSRVGSDLRPMEVKVENGGVLDGVGEIIGSLIIEEGGVSSGAISSTAVEITGDSMIDDLISDLLEVSQGVTVMNEGTADVDKLQIDNNAVLDGGSVNVTESVGGGGGTRNAPVTAWKIEAPSQPELFSQSAVLNIVVPALRIRPGDGIGSFTITHSESNAFTLDLPSDPASGVFEFEINDATGTMGASVGWDALIIDDGGTIFQGELGAGLTVSLTSLTQGDAPGALLNFDADTDYTWRFIDSELGFTGVPINDLQFLVDDAQFADANAIPLGRFRVEADGSTGLALIYDSSLLPGDYNGDGSIDAADYTVWRSSLGATGLIPYSGADGNGDGEVNEADFRLWRANFGYVAAPATATASLSIPEPATAVLALFFVGAVGVNRKR